MTIIAEVFLWSHLNSHRSPSAPVVTCEGILFPLDEFEAFSEKLYECESATYHPENELLHSGWKMKCKSNVRERFMSLKVRYKDKS